MGKCNYCHYRDIKTSAAKDKKKVVSRNYKGTLGGVDVFILPKNEQLPEELTKKDKHWKLYHVAWFMRLPNNCTC